MTHLEERIRVELDKIPIDFGGGCSLHKAGLMAHLICHYRLRVTADIGVYRGRSLLPQALAHRFHTGGLVFGIDPFTRFDAAQHDGSSVRERLQHWVETTHFDQLWEEVCGLVHRNSLEEHCRLIRRTSHAALKDFIQEEIELDFVHVDGNHDTDKVLQDVRGYLPRLRSGGYIILDDVSWPSIKPAADLLSTRLYRLYREKDGGNDFSVYWKGKGIHRALARMYEVRSFVRRARLR